MDLGLGLDAHEHPRLPNLRLTRLAAGGLAFMMVATAVYAVVLSYTSSRITASVARAQQVSRDYDGARFDVSEIESLERKYRLEPGADVRTRFESAVLELQHSLDAVHAETSGADARDAAATSGLVAPYLRAIDAMFDAVDRGSSATVNEIDETEVDPLFDEIRAQVTNAADRARAAAVGQLAVLERRQHRTLVLSPVIGAAALLMLVVCWRALRRFRRGMQHQATHDALTGLPTRTLLDVLAAAALESGQRSGASTALVLVDLDNFKDVNDAFGHRIGDELLCQVAARVRRLVRASDHVARLGGDEFAVLLTNLTDPDDALRLAEKVRATIERPYLVGAIGLDVEASCGLAVAPGHGTTGGELLQHADAAMHVAKRTRVGVTSYDSDLDASDPERLSMLGELRRALDNDELVVHYQPKGHLPDGALAGVEALVRWNHPTRGLVPPDEFIGLAERTSLIHVLTRQVLRKALLQCRAWLDEGLEVPVAVNVSTRCLSGDTLIPLVLSELAATGVPARLLELEITESAALADPEGTRDVLTLLHDRGVSVSIDDFGTGYSSLAYLGTLPVSTIKIDRSFVLNMLQSHSDAVIVRSVIDLGRNLGLTVVAEGLEDAETRDALAAAGCQLAQGYFWSRPQPAEALAGLIRAAKATAVR